MSSLEAHIREMNRLANDLVDDMNKYSDQFTDPVKERFWAIADGLTSRHIMDICQGRCSLALDTSGRV